MNLFRFTIFISVLLVPCAAMAADCLTIPFARRRRLHVAAYRAGADDRGAGGRRRNALATCNTATWCCFATKEAINPLIKAIRGLPGETLAVKDGKIIVNGKPATNSAGEPYQLSPARAAMIELYVHDYHGVIPPDAFLVMGELTRGAADSSRFGLVGHAAMIGKVIDNAAKR